MEARNSVLITVRCIPDEPRRSPYVVMRAHSLTLRSDGELFIQGETVGRTFGEGAWANFEVHRVPPFTGGDDA